jgi:hypothetical protein
MRMFPRSSDDRRYARQSLRNTVIYQTVNMLKLGDCDWRLFLPVSNSPTTRRRSYSIERGKSTFDVPGRLKMKSFPMIAAGVQQPAGKPRAMRRSTMAKELKTVRE